MTARIPVTPERKDALQDFAKGLGTTYDGAIDFLLGLALKNGETPLRAGDRLRPQFNPGIDREDEEE